MVSAAIERLEGRMLLAAGPFGGQVTARVEDGWLVIQGDAAANDLDVEAVSIPYRYAVGGGSLATTVNGQVGIEFFEGVTRGVRIAMGGGADRLEMTGIGPTPRELAGSDGDAYGLRIDMGTGDDELIVERVLVRGRSTFYGGAGADGIKLTDVRAESSLAVLPGSGHDLVRMTRVSVGGALEIDDRSGRADASFTAVSVAGRTTMRAGPLRDLVTLRDCGFGQRTRVTTGDGPDHVLVRGTTFATAALIDDGAGDDILDREVIMAWDFRRGRRGWRPGLSDHDRLPSSPDFADFDWQAGLADFPPEAGRAGTGFMVSSLNTVDDLFMYLSRPLTAGDGLLPGKRYTLSFEVEFATPYGAQGIGGHVYLKVGGAPRRPGVVWSEQPPSYRLNLDMGLQANSGTELSVAGDVVSNSSMDGHYFARRTHEHTHPIAADEQGRLWLVVGTDSAIERYTTIYFATIKVRLTPASG